jgi:thiol-disulfide isomerase/thioredoxin
MTKSTVITLGILLVILLVGSVVVYITQQRGAERLLQESPAAAALQNDDEVGNFTNIEGEAANLSQYLGQTMIVNSWASWAPSSVDELILLSSIAEKYLDQGVVVIGINRAESRVTAESFLSTFELQDSVQLIIDNEDKYYQSIGGYTMPETIFYDVKGDVIVHKRGVLTAAEIERVLEQALNAEK